MNVDKFGQHVHKRLRASNYFDVHNDALIKSETGYYDLKQNRLRGLPVAVSEDEAVNKEFVEYTLKKYYTKNEFDIKVKTAVDSYINQFQERLLEALSKSYYTRSEIDHILSRKNE